MDYIDPLERGGQPPIKHETARGDNWSVDTYLREGTNHYAIEYKDLSGRRVCGLKITPFPLPLEDEADFPDLPKGVLRTKTVDFFEPTKKTYGESEIPVVEIPVAEIGEYVDHTKRFFTVPLVLHPKVPAFAVIDGGLVDSVETFLTTDYMGEHVKAIAVKERLGEVVKAQPTEIPVDRWRLVGRQLVQFKSESSPSSRVGEVVSVLGPDSLTGPDGRKLRPEEIEPLIISTKLPLRQGTNLWQAMRPHLSSGSSGAYEIGAVIKGVFNPTIRLATTQERATIHRADPVAGWIHVNK